MMERIPGGVCAARGFKAGGIHCGMRRNIHKRDLSMILSQVPASAAAVYTTNLVKGAPLYVTQRNLRDGMAQMILCNSGNANTCNADGEGKAWQMCLMAADAARIRPEDVIVASTGVIGQPLPLQPIAEGLPPLYRSLRDNGSTAAAEGIMTLDKHVKETAVTFTVHGRECRLGGIAKGSGMVHPNMATILVFLTTDCAVSPAMLRAAMAENTQDTFNMISVDGDTSTNDMAAILANGMAGNPEITEKGADYDAFCAALHEVSTELCRLIAMDGEGATHLLTCRVSGAATREDARRAAKAVVCSSLFKAALFGADANWGRVLCALGYSGAQLDVGGIDVAFRSRGGQITVCEHGTGVPFSEESARAILRESEIEVLVTLRDGDASAAAWGCDLTYDYVKINGNYRS